MRAEESQTYSVLELTSRLFAPLFYQFVRPKLVALLTKLGKICLGFSEGLGPSPQDELLLFQTPDHHRALLKFQLFAYLGRKQDPSRAIQLNGELFHNCQVYQIWQIRKIWQKFLSRRGPVFDTQLLTLFVKMATFEPQRFRGVRHLEIMPFQFTHDDLALV